MVLIVLGFISTSSSHSFVTRDPPLTEQQPSVGLLRWFGSLSWSSIRRFFFGCCSRARKVFCDDNSGGDEEGDQAETADAEAKREREADKLKQKVRRN